MAEEIGRAKITVEADTEGVKASISDAKEEVESLGDSADEAGSKATGAFFSAGDAIDQSTEGMRKFQGAITGAIGAVTGLVAVGSGLVAVLVKIANRAKRAKEEAVKLASAYNDIEQSVNEYNLAYDETRDVDDERYFATLREINANEDLTDVYKLQLIEKANAVRESNKEVRQAERSTRVWSDYYRIRRALEAELTDDIIDNENALYAARGDALQAAFSDSGLIDTKFFKELEDLEEQLHQKRLANIENEKLARREAEFERIRREDIANQRREEAIRRQEQAIERSMERLAQNMTQLLTGSFGDNITTRLDTISKELKEVTSALGRR